MTRQQNDQSENEDFMLHMLPWISLSEEVRVAEIRFVPKDEFLKSAGDAGLKVRVENLLRCFQGNDGKSVKTGIFCVPVENDNVKAHLDIAVSCLAFSTSSIRIVGALADKNFTWPPLWSDAFEYWPILLKADNTHFVTYKRSENALWAFTGAKFTRPLGVGFNCGPNGSLLAALSHAIEITPQTDDVLRIMRAISWFFHANVDSALVREESRVVMLASALELSSSIGEKVRDKATCLGNAVNQCFSGEKAASEKREIAGKEVDWCKAAWWAFDFYKLRNNIVHGEEVSRESLQLSVGSETVLQSHIASFVLIRLIVMSLVKHGYWFKAHMADGDIESNEDEPFDAKFGKLFAERSVDTMCFSMALVNLGWNTDQ